MLGGGLAGGAMGGGGAAGGGGMSPSAASGIISGIQGIGQGIGQMFTPGTLRIPTFGALPQLVQTTYPTLGSQTFMA